MSSISIETKKIIEMDAITEVGEDDLLIVRTGAGTKKVRVGDFLGGISAEGSYIAGLHNNGAGRNLGNQLTTEQAQMIAAGDFKNLWNGDYWVKDGKKIRIVDNTNWYKARGDQGDGFNKPHLVVMCDENVLKSDGSTTRYMQDTNVTTGGYAGTKYRANYKNTAKSFFTEFFGTAHISGYRGLISTAVNTTTGRASSWAWSDCDVELPTEDMIFGTSRWGDGAGNGYGSGSFHGQMQLFRLAPEYIVAKTAAGARENYWEQNVVSAADFAFVSTYGHAHAYGASHTRVGCRPFALLI